MLRTKDPPGGLSPDADRLDPGAGNPGAFWAVFYAWACGLGGRSRFPQGDRHLVDRGGHKVEKGSIEPQQLPGRRQPGLQS